LGISDVHIRHGPLRRIDKDIIIVFFNFNSRFSANMFRYIRPIAHSILLKSVHQQNFFFGAPRMFKNGKHQGIYDSVCMGSLMGTELDAVGKALNTEIEFITLCTLDSTYIRYIFSTSIAMVPKPGPFAMCSSHLIMKKLVMM
jgi:hypothetical protein